jgi:1-deoxy-D-xylulose-5-phosphate synthase
MIEKIQSPKDLKKLRIDELNILASEIREALIKKMSIKGGHFGPNLGSIELEIALHYVFDSPRDKFVFDV